MVPFRFCCIATSTLRLSIYFPCRQSCRLPDLISRRMSLGLEYIPWKYLTRPAAGARRRRTGRFKMARAFRSDPRDEDEESLSLSRPI